MIRLHPEIARFLGLEEIPEALLDDCIERVKLRCGNVESKLYRRRPLQAMMVAVAKEAVVACYQDYFPHANKLVSNSWPWATCTIRGNSARIEIWIGQDYDEGDGIEPFDIKIVRGDGKTFSEIIQDILKRKLEPKHEPELVLKAKTPEWTPPPPPAPPEPVTTSAPAPRARGKRILDG